MTVTELIMHDLQSGNITLEKALKLIFKETNRMLYVIPKKMKNKIIIEGKEFELPDELVNKIKEELNKPKKLTYDDIMSFLFSNKDSYYVYHDGDIRKGVRYSLIHTNCTCENQAKKLLAINKLMNVAKYLNADWKHDHDFKSTASWKFALCMCPDGLYIDNHLNIKSVVYFKTEELANQAIEILGEDVIRTALSTDW